MNPSRARVVVVGAGPGGLVAARVLREAGFSTVVLDQRPAEELLADVGGAYDMGAEVIAVFRALGLETRAREVGLAWSALEVCDRAGRSLRVLPMEGLDVLSLRRSELQRILADGLMDGLRGGAEVLGVRDGPGPVRVELAGGEEIEADLVIGADGVHSAVRRTVLPDGPPRFCGAMAAWGWLPAEDPAVAGWARDRGHLMLGGPGSAMGGAVGARFIWSVMWPAARFERGPSGAERVAQVRAVVQSGIPGFSRVLDASDPAQIAVVGIWDRDPAPRWTAGRVALVGDAAHAMSPVLGQGAQSAIVDGFTLARLLARHEPGEAFRRFEERRIAGVNRNLLSARRMTPWLLPTSGVLLWATRAFFRWVPVSILRDGMLAANRENEIGDLIAAES